MSTITFHQLNATHALRYQQLRAEALTINPESFLSTIETEQKKSLLLYEYELTSAQYPPIFGYHGVFVDQVLVGYAQLGCSQLPKQHHSAFLYNLYVAKDYRRQGLAAALLKHLILLLKQETTVEQVFVTCNAKNTQGSQFYQAFGFTNWGRRPNSVKWQHAYDDELEWVLKLE